MAECKAFDPGTLRHRVTLQQVSQVTDGQGGFTESWSDVTSLWGLIEPTKGYEKFQAQQLQTPVTHKITLRYRSGVTTKHRLLYGSRVFHIKEVINVDEAKSFLRLTCQEVG